MTISACLIVKNEEKVLGRCLNSIKDLVDEIIIVDTGSTDATKEIASIYTDKIYDFPWNDDFSAARNYSFRLASMNYIYAADADEYLDEENRKQFAILKDNLSSEIEIVQMMYNTVSEDTVLNIKKEYRPKLFKRLRTFSWIDPIHETVRLTPIVFDSDVVITHAPTSNHASRDFGIYQKALGKNGSLSRKVTYMYATELYKCGTLEDLREASPYFTEIFNTTEDTTLYQATASVLCKWLRLEGDDSTFVGNATAIAGSNNGCSEIAYELGQYYFNRENYRKAARWLDEACHILTPVIDVHSGGDDALDLLIKAYEKLPAHGRQLEATRIELQNWSQPEEELPV